VNSCQVDEKASPRDHSLRFINFAICFQIKRYTNKRIWRVLQNNYLETLALERNVKNKGVVNSGIESQSDRI
jgi:hypothetical protein